LVGVIFCPALLRCVKLQNGEGKEERKREREKRKKEKEIKRYKRKMN